MQLLTLHDKKINHHKLKLQGQATLKLQISISGIHDNSSSDTKLMYFFKLTKKQSPKIKTQYAKAWFKVGIFGFMYENKGFFWVGLSVYGCV